ncbi:MAG TPA: MgtC/SapB family protein [Thiotrichales bacterium]|nr:MgtC/SapB family protein [Thiotrichales bacterium]
MEIILDLLLALALGLLIGAERGWKMRRADEGSRLAGIRTFGLIGLLGALWALLAQQMGDLLLGISFAVLGGLLLISHLRAVQIDRDQGLTTVTAALITFALGAMVMRDLRTIAAVAAVLTTTILSLKPVLHAWLERIEPGEFYATLKLLLISVVLLPVLPDKGYGPWQALNPYQLWWFVVLITGISFTGYVAVRLFGPGRGILLTGFLGGLTSSTATTLHFARLAREGSPPALLAAGTLTASATMFPRMLVIVTIVNQPLLARLWWPMTLMFLVAVAGAGWLWLRNAESNHAPSGLVMGNPFQLLPALKFGALLAAVMLATRALNHWYGDAGVMAAAAISGLGDVDAITLSLSQLVPDELSGQMAVAGIVLAAVSNTLVKGILGAVIGGRRMALALLPAMLLSAAAGAFTLLR